MASAQAGGCRRAAAVSSSSGSSLATHCANLASWGAEINEIAHHPFQKQQLLSDGAVPPGIRQHRWQALSTHRPQNNCTQLHSRMGLLASSEAPLQQPAHH